MNRIHPHLQEVNLIAKLADLKDNHYQQSLLLTALIEVLTDKGILTTQELSGKMQELDNLLTPDPMSPIS
jgi:hypothetical protein